MLMKTESGIVLNTDPVQIGSHHTRTHAIERDSHTGRYWERLPTFSESEERVQRALLFKLPTVREIAVTIELMNGCSND